MITQGDIETFTELADVARLKDSQEHLNDVLARLRINPKLGSSQLRDALYEAIRIQIVDIDRPEAVSSRALKSILIRRFRFGLDQNPDYELVAWILYGVNNDFMRPLSDRSKWLTALSAVLTVMRVPGHKPTEQIGADDAGANAALKLRSRGYRLRLEVGEFRFEERDFESCCDELNRLAARVGGKIVASTLLRHLQQQLRFSNGRYRVGRNTSLTGLQLPDPAIPYGLLFNIAARHMKGGSASVAKQENLERLLELARDLVAVMDVETYSAYAPMFTSYRNLPTYMRRATLGDFWLGLPQHKPQHVLTILEGLFGWVDPRQMQDELGWTMDDALRLAKTILYTIPADSINTVFTAKRLKSAGFKESVLNRMLPYFSHRTDELNRDFLVATDSEKANLTQKPLIRQPGDKLLLLSPPLCAAGFYEVMAAAARTLQGDADSKIGSAIEPLLADVFQQHSIEPTTVSGAYESEGRNYDCDLALETKEAVLLFEVKKKSLTRASSSGNSLQTLYDLSASILKAQTQLGIQEIELQRTGNIKFSDGRTLYLRERRVERIAVTLLDWGSIQYRTIADNIIKVMVNSHIDYEAGDGEEIDETTLKRVQQCNRLTERLRAQHHQLSDLGIEREQPFFDWTFLSVPQLLALLERTSSVEEFYGNLRTVKHIALGSLDFYETLSHMQSIKGANKGGI